MRLTHRLLAVAGLAVLVTATAEAGTPRPFKVSVTTGKLTVLPEKGWHVNEDYPWVTRAPGKPWSRNFSILPFAATASDLPSGPVQFRGGLCSDTTCVPIKGEVVMP